MRKFFTSRACAVMVLVLLLCMGSILYSSATGTSNPAAGTANTVLAPVQRVFNQVVKAAQQGTAYFTEYDTVAAENVQLKRDLREAEQKLRDAQAALEENSHLRSLVGIKERNPSFEFEIAEVIARPVGNWQSTLTLDKGEQDGIKEGCLVITEDGMLGYVVVTAQNYCEITTVIDTEMQAGAIITRSREVAIAEGDYTMMDEGLLRLSYLKQDADIVIGDTVETSGRGGLFPKGIMIGTVEQILPEDHGISNYAVVRPFVDVDKVSCVFIIKSFEVTD